VRAAGSRVSAVAVGSRSLLRSSRLATVTGEMGRTCWRHSSQRSTSSVTVRGAAAALLAPVELLQELGLDLPGLAPGRLGLAANLPAEPSLAADEGVAAGEYLDLEAAAGFLITLPPMSRAPTVSLAKQRGIEGC
jgi:hypothetical protein